MMNMSPAILNYTVKFNQTVAAVRYNDTNCSFSSLHCVFISRSLRFITPESPRLLQLRFSSLRCDGFDFRAEVRIRLCFSVILHSHRLKTERENTINQIYCMTNKPITNYTKVTKIENQQTYSLRCD